MPQELPDYFAGAKMAYGDCAVLAELLAKHSDRFAEEAMSHGISRERANDIALSGKVTLSSFADAIREKIANLEQMVEAAKNGPQ